MRDIKGLPTEVKQKYDQYVKDNIDYVLYDWSIEDLGDTVGRLTVILNDTDERISELKFYIITDLDGIWFTGKLCETVPDSALTDEVYYYKHTGDYVDEAVPDLVDCFITGTFKHFKDDLKWAGLDTDAIEYAAWDNWLTHCGYKLRQCDTRK